MCQESVFYLRPRGGPESRSPVPTWQAARMLPHGGPWRLFKATRLERGVVGQRSRVGGKAAR